MASAATVAFEASLRHITPVTVPPEERERLTALMALLRDEAVGQEEHAAGYKLLGPTGEVHVLSEPVFLLLERIIEVLASGDALTVVPVGKELTTQQAAHILNVSRQYVVRLLEEGELPHSKTGTHRRVRMEDVLAYKRQRDRARMASLDELSQLSQDFGGYTELNDEEG